MALKALMLRKTLDGLNAKLEAARKKSTELVTREAELEESINEAESDDEKAAVNEAVEEYDKEKEYYGKHWSEVHEGKYKPLWVQRGEKHRQ